MLLDFYEFFTYIAFAMESKAKKAKELRKLIEKELAERKHTVPTHGLSPDQITAIAISRAAILENVLAKYRTKTYSSAEFLSRLVLCTHDLEEIAWDYFRQTIKRGM